jgi:hypothetical protein
LGTLEYDIGEKKYATATVRSSNKNESVIIRTAKWELYDKPDAAPDKAVLNGFYGNPEDPEGCLINENTVSALIDTTTLIKGNYILKFTIEVGPERIIDKCVIKVS